MKYRQAVILRAIAAARHAPNERQAMDSRPTGVHVGGSGSANMTGILYCAIAPHAAMRSGKKWSIPATMRIPFGDGEEKSGTDGH